jgi:hypothetical protein
MEWLILIGVLAVVFSGLGGWVAIQKRRDVAEGLTLGLSFRPLGVLFEASLPQGAKQPGNSQTGSGGRRNIENTDPRPAGVAAVERNDPYVVYV